jgi:Fibronectin type III domain
MAGLTHVTKAILGGAALAVLAAFVPATASPASADSGPAAPGGLTVARAPDSPQDLVVSWKPVSSADHYNVSVFDGSSDRVTTVPAATTSLRVRGAASPCTQYRITVGSRDVAGAGATTGFVWVHPLAPGAVSGLRAARASGHTSATASWSAPAWHGYGTFTGYTVQVVRVTDGAVVQSRRSADAVENVAGLVPTKQYVVKVWAANAYGECGVARAMLGNQNPGSPTGLTVVRDAGVPADVRLTWKAPAWHGYSDLTGYLVGYGTSRITSWASVTGTALNLKLPNVTHVFSVRAVNEDGPSTLSPVVKQMASGLPGRPAVTPAVTLDTADGTVTVTTVGPVGSSATYPRLLMRVRPSTGTGYTDAQYGQNGAQTMVFSSVPCGSYSVTVTGVGPTGESEFARKVVNQCDTGFVSAAEWKVVAGQATLTRGTVDMPAGQESRVMSTRVRASADMTLSTTATLRSGWGYGVFARASFSSTGLVSGYSFQVDPGYANVDGAFGPAFLLRQWHDGTECGIPIARTRIPAGFALNTAHRLTVVVKGDGLYAVIDNMVVFDVPSLAAAIKGSYCQFPAPTGTGVGFRTWSWDASAVFTDTTLN